MTEKVILENEKRIEQNIEIVCNKVKQLIDMVPPELYYMRSLIAEQVAYNAALDGSDNHYEAIGILEEAKLNFREVSKSIHDAEAKEQAEQSNSD